MTTKEIKLELTKEQQDAINAMKKEFKIPLTGVPQWYEQKLDPKITVQSKTKYSIQLKPDHKALTPQINARNTLFLTN